MGISGKEREFLIFYLYVTQLNYYPDVFLFSLFPTGIHWGHLKKTTIVHVTAGKE